MKKFFSNNIDDLLWFMFKIYNKIDGRKTVREIASSSPYKKGDNLIKIATAISMLSIFRIIRSKEKR